MLFLTAGIIALDQAIKSLIRLTPVGSTLFEVPGVFSLTHSINTGAAFSLFSGRPMLLAILSIGLLAAIIFYARKSLRLTKPARVALACMLGGGIGNQMDRVFLSGVTDYIRLLFIDFPVFNLADMAITLSVMLLLFLLLTDALEETTEEKHGSDH